MGVGLIAIAFITSLMQDSLCQEWSVALPKTIRGINGSCLRVPCHFEVPASYYADLVNCTNFGVWKKGSVIGQDVFTSGKSKDNNIIQGEITGDLTRKNCTTVFSSFPEGYNDAYFFRLNCPKRLKFTFFTAVYLNFQSAPPPPQLTSVREVSEGDQLTLRCSAPVPCPALPPTLTWLPLAGHRDEVIQTQQGSDALITMTSTLTFTASPSHHNQTITCSVFYPLAQGGSTELSASTQTLSIQYRPRVTVASLSPSDPVSEGQAVTLTCSSDANPPVQRYTWFRDVGGQLNRRAEGDQLLLIASRNESGIYLCEAQNQRGSQRSRPVALEVALPTGSSSECPVLVPSIICGVVAVLYILTLIVNVCKHQSLSRRLKQIELTLKGEHTYATLRGSRITSDYDQFQPKTAPRVQAPCNENPITMEVRGQRSGQR